MRLSSLPWRRLSLMRRSLPDLRSFSSDLLQKDPLRFAPPALMQHLRENLPPLPPSERLKIPWEESPVDPIDSQSRGNFERVVGVHPQTLSRHFNDAGGWQSKGPAFNNSDIRDRTSVERFRDWQKINRGKDLFLRGVGRFDIKAAIDSLSERQLQCLEINAQNWLVSDTIDYYSMEFDLILSASLRRMLRKRTGTAKGTRHDVIRKLSEITRRCFREPSCQGAICNHCECLSKLSVFCTDVSGSDFLQSARSPDELPDELCGPELQHVLADPQGLLFPPSSIQAHGLFSKALSPDLDYDEYYSRRQQLEILLQADETSPQRKHLLRFSDYYNDHDNANTLDELDVDFDGVPWPEGVEEMPPPRLQRHLRELARIRQMGPDVHFLHLDSLADLPLDSAGGLMLRVLRSSHEVVRMGEALHNCAAMYGRRVQNGECVLVALVKLAACGEAEQPVALAEYRCSHQSNDWSCVQMVENNNESASSETRAHFKPMPGALKAWSESN